MDKQCNHCSGTGEGRTSDTLCRPCKGTGTVLIEIDWDAVRDYRRDMEDESSNVFE